MKKFLISILILFTTSLPGFAGEIDMARLDAFAKNIIAEKSNMIGFPVNENVELEEFYRWYADSGLADVAMNNVGNPRAASLIALNTHQFENEVIDFFAPKYGFTKEDVWGIVTYSGTDGNNHGIYFGVKYLQSLSKLKPALCCQNNRKKLNELMVI
ncbi:hypothetical protein SAMN05660860_01170 [Geoalkalibacter ferrihydriticus]|uniref:Uncharacterized protein n=2 Tax=Geoalkalibacter ferrihydriticus TaxID=392333 RepID=A0A0C2EGF4_9BACT|nr:hypothetical protein [Geoalkalibacter ferrihydriticus]KIH77698.1 hypothetical protein GFER_03280 [Geoalkalibacter ferrihydriticus DSM 17813]SDL74328.1 hypothetical protein SAMN05660860_01170 [Geoalkalibacter ferrihydriticus]